MGQKVKYMVSDSCNTLVVGGGLSGLALATFLKKENPDIDLLLLEAGKRPGGAIRSFDCDGFLAEWGAHGFLDNCAESRELLRISGLDAEIQKAPLGKFVRYICLGGRLRLIPQSPPKIIASPIMPLTAKLRVLADLWKKPCSHEQSIAQWAGHRFGRGVLPFVDAALTGTSAGDMEKLSIDAVMPGLRKLELEHGSVIRGLFRRQRKRKAVSGKKKGELPAMISFPGGMERLPRGLAAGLRQGGELLLNTGVSRIRRREREWLVTSSAGEFRCRNLVLALPVNSSLQLLKEDSLGLPAPPVDRLAETRIATVVLGFTDETEIPFGFGYLAPEQEKRFCLGAMFSSHMFAGRAPAGHVLVEALVGGRRHPERLQLEDDPLVEAVMADLRQLLPIAGDPCFTRVLRQEAAFPQLEMGYPRLLAWRDRICADQPGLHVCGFGWEGIGINDMVRQAKRIASAIIAGDETHGREAEVKGVYF